MVTIRDIAKYAHVSPGTVSRVLNEDPSLSVNPDTRARIQRIAKEMNYAGKTRASRQIQIVTHASKSKEMADPYYRELRLAIEKEVKQLNLSLKKTIRTDNIKTLTELKQLEKSGGVIVIGPFQNEVIQALYQYNSNVVLINQTDPPTYIDTVSSDLYQAMMQLLHTIDQHHFNRVCYVGGLTKVRHIGNESNVVRDDDRQVAYLDWCKAHHIEPYYFETTWQREGAHQVIQDIVGGVLPDMIVAGNDMLAVGLIQELQKQHINVPNDIKIVSFNDSEVAEYTVPMLTSVHIPIEEFGRQAVRLLLERMQHRRQVAIHMQLETSIHYRDSF
ncbi:LacI family DNA-binding transcriptional regulator [Staphylococcus canis]|uniref:LacI family transcriptional regulator n=1 Tax=Staphylococcus canis TaxID=2724942 RepID=A0ABS0T791_9STAP|nr:LacI family DNA-binding transcriptional regulator [Staphylococcus canis]MBI5974619.1 LacI family transcriptional regulator [Staphylococcus canis]